MLIEVIGRDLPLSAVEPATFEHIYEHVTTIYKSPASLDGDIGIPMSRYMDSGLCHAMKWLRGDRDGLHLGDGRLELFVLSGHANADRGRTAAGGTQRPALQFFDDSRQSARHPSHRAATRPQINMDHPHDNMLASVDVETTGVVPGYHEIVQITVVPLDGKLYAMEGVAPSGCPPLTGGNCCTRPP